jgi:hypothetical protein
MPSDGISRHEAPADAVFVADVTKPTCEIIEYRSRTLYTAMRYRTMDAELSRTALGGTYRGIVGDILFGPPISPKNPC